jgi:hypothetical protein
MYDDDAWLAQRRSGKDSSAAGQGQASAAGFRPVEINTAGIFLAVGVENYQIKFQPVQAKFNK